MECRSGADVDDYLYLDAKLLKGGDVAPKSRAPFQDAIIFVIGGGNYIEYQNLVDFIKVSRDVNFNSLKPHVGTFIPAKKHGEHHQAHHLRLLHAEQREAVPEAAFTPWTGDQGRKLMKLCFFFKFYLTSFVASFCPANKS